MVIRMDLYTTHEGKEFGVGSGSGKDGRGAGKFAGQKGNLETIEEGPQPDLVTKMVRKRS